MPRPIIIDTDPGTDDAVAILLALAAPELDLLGLAAVAGNAPLVATERNARAVLELAGRTEVPVYAGCPRPIGGGAISAEHAHGESGLGGLELPPPQLALQPGHGVDFLVEALRTSPPRSITVCALGPLTNLAAALIKAPDIAERIGELVVMGGASYALGNTTPCAEFNLHADPVDPRNDGHRLARDQRPTAQYAGHDEDRCRRLLRALDRTASRLALIGTVRGRGSLASMLGHSRLEERDDH